MIKDVRLKNFKSFKKAGKINIGKINVFVGPNSSGKSSFIQGLLLLKNAIQCVVEKQYKNLEGDYKSLVYHKDTTNKIEYTITFDDPNDLFLNLAEEKLTEVFTDIETNDIIKARKRYENIDLKSMTVSLKVVEEGMHTDEFEINTFEISTNEDSRLRVSIEDGKYKLRLADELLDDLVVLNSCKFYFQMHKMSLKGLDEDKKQKILLTFLMLQKLEANLIDFSNKLIYMGSLRTDFLRSEDIDISDSSASSVGSRGQRTLATLRKIDKCCGTDCDVKYKKAKIDHWLDEFDLGDKIEVKKTSRGRFSIMIRNKYLDIYNNILDVGIGTAQLLPIIIEAVNSKNDSLIIVEEPETHIHPKEQAKLADLFVGCAKNDNKRFIIETHSIFLVTQLQILVASGEISKDDVNVYFFDQDREGTKIKEMILLSNGQFEEEWPSGFFDIHYELGRKLFELM